MKDSIGYILTSFFLVIVFDAIVMATFVSLLPKEIIIQGINLHFMYLSNVVIAVAWVYFVYLHGT